ncbi:hypothetical protein [Streptomyces hokutonensis]|uniref:hypothetical protein n=1 Tax=Streptomyces hokutonensis TaxID=1306990 RepID=UPI0037FD9380
MIFLPARWPDGGCQAGREIGGVDEGQRDGGLGHPDQAALVERVARHGRDLVEERPRAQSDERDAELFELVLGELLVPEVRDLGRGGHERADVEHVAAGDPNAPAFEPAGVTGRPHQGGDRACPEVVVPHVGRCALQSACLFFTCGVAYAARKRTR